MISDDKVYYSLLGVSEQAGVAEIKRAFRKKAKELHPDINKSDDAQVKFVALVKAYEYLIAVKTGKRFSSSAKQATSNQSHARWQDDQAERARRRAAYYRSKATTQKPRSNLPDSIWALPALVFSFLMVTAMPIYVISNYGLNGLIATIIVLLIFSPVIKDAYQSIGTIPKSDFPLWINFLKSESVAGWILSILNIILFLKVGFQTLIPLTKLLYILIQISALLFLINYFLRKKTFRKSFFIASCLFPFILNIFLTINFIFSKNPVKEEYAFTPRQRYYKGKGWESISHIDLANKQYDDYPGIRVFSDVDNVRFHHNIVYVFEDGLFGIKVMKHYYFD